VCCCQAERENGKRMDGWIDVVGEGMVWDGWWVGCVGWGGGQGEGESQRTSVRSGLLRCCELRRYCSSDD
jgi:hypothetical protein